MREFRAKTKTGTTDHAFFLLDSVFPSLPILVFPVFVLLAVCCFVAIARLSAGLA